jgi:hypothetical protein
MRILIFIALAVLAGTVYGQTPYERYGETELSTGLEFSLRLDETSGTTATDSSGNGNDGTYIVNTPNGPRVIPEGAGSLTGAANCQLNGYIEAPNPNLQDVTGAQRSFTIVLFVRADVDLMTVGDGYDCGSTSMGIRTVANCLGWIRGGNGLAGNVVYVDCQIDPGLDGILEPDSTCDDPQGDDKVEDIDRYRVEVCLGTACGTFLSISYDGADFDPTEEHFFALVNDETADEATLYVDGDSFTEDGVTLFSQVADDFRFGQESVATPALSRGFDGEMDGILFWIDVAQPDEEIVELRRRGLAGEPFIRGDANQDGVVTPSDATRITQIFTLGPLMCNEAGDADSSGNVTPADATFILNCLFVPMAPCPAAPFPGCGEETMHDSLTCLDGRVCD